MPAGTKSDFRIYHEELHSGMAEAIDVNVDAFNEASAGTIQLVTQAHRGDYLKSGFFAEISGLVSRRDVTSVSAAADTAMTEVEHASVKINRKVGPIAQTIDAFRKIGSDESEMSLVLGGMIGPRIVKDQILTVIKAIATAVAGNSGVVNDVSASEKATYPGLVGALAKFGDMASEIRCLVFHSKAWFDLLAANVTASTELSGIGATGVLTGTLPGLGRRVLVIDSPDLVVTGSPNKYRTLGLVEGGAVCMESEEATIVTDLVTGLENLVVRLQGEHAYTIGLKGYTWDTANGGANPANAAIATASNWDKIATYDKATAGVCLLSQ